ARERLVVDVHREQVIAGVQPLVDVVEEIGAGQALAHQPSLQAGNSDDYGVALARLGLANQLLQRDLGGLLLPARLSIRTVGSRRRRSFARRGAGARHVESLLLI